MNVERAFAENPSDEIWRRLRYWTYERNVKRRLEAKHAGAKSSARAKLAEEITVLMLQAQEYFQAAQAVDLYTRPLQLYYGTVALLVALTLYERGQRPNISNHGLNLCPCTSDLLDWRVNVDAKTRRGCAQAISPVISDGLDLNACGGWTIRECFGSVPDIAQDAARDPKRRIELHVLPLTIGDTNEGVCYLVEAIGQLPLPANWDEIVWRRSEVFLPPQMAQSGSAVFRPRLRASNAEDVLPLGTDGRLYLILMHEKNGGKYYHSVLLMYFLGLFSLGMLSRYYPVAWGKLIGQDDSGDLELFRSFMSSSARQVPNLVLNHLSGKTLVFSSEHPERADFRQKMTSEKIEQLINDSIEKRLRRK